MKDQVLAISHPYDRNKVGYIFFNPQKGFKLDKYFSEVKLFKSSRDAMYSLFFNASDVVFETEYSFDVFRKLRPELTDSIKAIYIDEDIMADLPIFYRASVDPEKLEKIEKIKQFFLKMHKDAGLYQMLVFMGCDRVMPITKKEETAYRIWIRKYRAMELIPRDGKRAMQVK